MKEKRFNFRKSFYNAIRPMDDKQAGKFIKGLCAYVFDSRPFNAKDSALQSTFELVKTVLDNEQRDRENGRKGGIESAKLRRVQEAVDMKMVAEARLKGMSLDAFIDLMTVCEQDNSGGKSVGK